MLWIILFIIFVGSPMLGVYVLLNNIDIMPDSWSERSAHNPWIMGELTDPKGDGWGPGHNEDMWHGDFD